MSVIKKEVIVSGGETVPRADTARILERSDGTLVMVYNRYAPSQKQGEDFGLGRISRQFSYDEGRTWEDDEVIIEIGKNDTNVLNAALCQLEDDTILLTAIRHHSPNSTSCVYYQSTDGGQTFRKKEPIWSELNNRRSPGGAAGLYRLANERILLPVSDTPNLTEGKSLSHEEENKRVGCYWSDDNGESWNEPVDWQSVPMRGAMEPSVAELPNGELVMSIRTQLGSVFISRSHDHGKSWTKPQPFGPPSSENCTCLRCHPVTGDLILFWNPTRYDHNHHHYGNRNHLAAAVSDDRGRTWSRPYYIERSRRTNFTNPGCTFTSDGEALLTYMSATISPDAYGEDWSREGISLNLAIIPNDWFYLYE